MRFAGGSSEGLVRLVESACEVYLGGLVSCGLQGGRPKV